MPSAPPPPPPVRLDPPQPPPVQATPSKKPKVTLKGVLIIAIIALLAFIGVRMVRPAYEKYSGYVSAPSQTSAAVLVLGTNLLNRTQRVAAAKHFFGEKEPGAALDFVAHHRGLALQTHRADLNSAFPTATKRLLSDADRWDAVVVQGQSQVLGLWFGHPHRVLERQSIFDLRNAAAKVGAPTFIYMTWGFKEGDPMNKIWPNYLRMQNSLSTGAQAVAQLISTEEAQTYVVPVGLAFQQVYIDDVVLGRQPPVRHADLYTGYKYPSQAAGYLSAAVLSTAVFGDRLRQDPGTFGGLSASQTRYLRSVANRVVLDGTLGRLPFPSTTRASEVSSIESACRKAYRARYPERAVSEHCSQYTVMHFVPEKKLAFAFVSIPSTKEELGWIGLFGAAISSDYEDLQWTYAGEIPADDNLAPSSAQPRSFTRLSYIASKSESCENDDLVVLGLERQTRLGDPLGRTSAWGFSRFGIVCKANGNECIISTELYRDEGQCTHGDELTTLTDDECGRAERIDRAEHDAAQQDTWKRAVDVFAKCPMGRRGRLLAGVE